MSTNGAVPTGLSLNLPADRSCIRHDRDRRTGGSTPLHLCAHHSRSQQATSRRSQLLSSPPTPIQQHRSTCMQVGNDRDDGHLNGNSYENYSGYNAYNNYSDYNNYYAYDIEERPASRITHAPEGRSSNSVHTSPYRYNSHDDYEESATSELPISQPQKHKISRPASAEPVEISVTEGDDGSEVFVVKKIKKKSKSSTSSIRSSKSGKSGKQRQSKSPRPESQMDTPDVSPRTQDGQSPLPDTTISPNDLQSLMTLLAMKPPQPPAPPPFPHPSYNRQPTIVMVLPSSKKKKTSKTSTNVPSDSSLTDG